MDEFREWYLNRARYCTDIYNYFSQFEYETKVFPKVGDLIEFSVNGNRWIKGKLCAFVDDYNDDYIHIRPVSTPTREEVIAQVESKLKSNELTFDRELVEQFLNILKGRDNE